MIHVVQKISIQFLPTFTQKNKNKYKYKNRLYSNFQFNLRLSIFNEICFFDIYDKNIKV